ncbi:unnamed protein product [Dibothriocephalus latus]|uniref:Dynein light chain n=1 Tax=Dibothriocephalus latus TaxID=60516 RepID=A0A3P7LST2_DIBLA|nr:unnamed protein product [Dibothriocephalus latus]
MSKDPNLFDAIVYDCKLPDDQQKAIVQMGMEALEETTELDHICKYVKHQMELKYGNGWCCICGSQFSTCVACVDEDFMHFHLGYVDFVIFRV